MRPPSRFGRRLGVRILGVLAAILIGLGTAPSASAHSDFAGSEPDDGAVVDAPLAAMTMRFAVGVLDPGSGFVARGAGDQVVVARSSSIDGRVWELVFEPPVAGDPVTITYDVIAQDGHRVNGEVVVTTSVSSPTTVIPNPMVSVTIDPTTPAPRPSASDQMGMESSSPTSAASWADPVEHIGRLGALGGSLVGIGLLVFGWGPARHRRPTPYPAMIAGAFATVAAAAVTESLGFSERTGLSFTTVIGDTWGRSSLLRLLGAIGIVITIVGRTQRWWTLRRHIERRLVAGCALAVAIAPAFDGHAVSQGPRALHLVADLLHVVATAVWVGAVIGLVIERRRSDSDLADIARRVSRLLILTVGVVGFTGVVMTLMILDGSWDWGSAWIRILAAKIAFVALAGALGWHHHRRVLAGRAEAVTQSTLAVEATAFVGAVISTSWLVAAMP